MTLLDVFNENSIDYETSGKHSTQGFINTHCPFCDDSSSHLGWKNDASYTNCWRCGWHNTYDSLLSITNLDKKEVINIIKQLEITENHTFYTKKERKNKNNVIKIPNNYNFIDSAIKYIENRNFNFGYLQKKYDLRWGGIVGDWKYRIIIPIYQNCRLVSFQGRIISSKIKPKYKFLSNDKSIILPKNLIFNYDNCKNDSIIVCEGVMDVFRLGNNTCCLFGIEYTEKQKTILSEYKNVFILFDNEDIAQKKARKLANSLCLLNCNVEIIQIDKNDPAELSEKEVLELKRELNFF
jgi:hypothetical protein